MHKKMNKKIYKLTEVPKHVFRAYDIRGEINKDLNE